jgi:hypothetical protein
MIEHRHHALQDDGPVIVFLVSKVDRASAQLDAIRERGLMYP